MGAPSGGELNGKEGTPGAGSTLSYHPLTALNPPANAAGRKSSPYQDSGRPDTPSAQLTMSSGFAPSANPWPRPQAAASGGDVRERRLAKFRQNVARFRLYRLRFLQENMRFAAFFKIYQILKLKFLKFDKILQILRHLQFFC